MVDKINCLNIMPSINKISIPDGNDPNNPVRIYTDGIFDCFHYGHAKLLEQIKKMFPHVYLVVGVCSDEDTTNNKGLTVMTMEERVECVRHCKWADAVHLRGPWLPTVEFLDSIKCHYIAHDPEPYPIGDNPDCYGPFKEQGRFLPTQRTEGISTTDIINRIIRHYDIYLERSIRKGSTASELNISKAKYLAIKLMIIIKKIEKRLRKKKEINLKQYFIRWNKIG
jgi:choline-phosphate cytidylyltransferase